MTGNVAKWTNSYFDNNSYNTASRLNPNIRNNEKNQKKVIRGRSWKDIGYYLQVGVRDWEHEDSIHS